MAEKPDAAVAILALTAGQLFIMTWWDKNHPCCALWERGSGGMATALINNDRTKAGTVYSIGTGTVCADNRIHPLNLPAPVVDAIHMLILHDQLDAACRLVGDPWSKHDGAS